MIDEAVRDEGEMGRIDASVSAIEASSRMLRSRSPRTICCSGCRRLLAISPSPSDEGGDSHSRVEATELKDLSV